MPHPVPVRRTALFTALALACGPVAPITTYTSTVSARQDHAAGGPIFQCDELRAVQARMRAGLPAKDDTIRKTQEQLDAARRGVKESVQELQMLALKEATTAAVHELDFVRQAKSGIAKSAASNETRLKLNGYVDKVKDAADKIQGLVTSGASGVNVGAAVRENQLTMTTFLKELDESGIADEFGKVAFTAIFGPAGDLAFDLATAARDVVLAGWGYVNNVSEADAAQQTLDTLQTARAAIQSRLYEINEILTAPGSNCAQPTTPPPDRIVTQPPAADPPPYTPVPAPAPAPKHGGGGQAVAGILLGGAAAAALYGYAKNKYGPNNNCVAPDVDIPALCSPRTSACSAALADEVAYCQCKGFATFDSAGGSCK